MCKLIQQCECAGSKILWTLVIIGALNWGFVGALDVDLVQLLFGSVVWLATAIYILVGLAGLALLLGGCRCLGCKGSSYGHKGKGRCCGTGHCKHMNNDRAEDVDN